MVKIADISLGEFPLLLAPMEDVSDPPFRAVCKENGADSKRFFASEAKEGKTIVAPKRPTVFCKKCDLFMSVDIRLFIDYSADYTSPKGNFIRIFQIPTYRNSPRNGG